MSNCVIRRFIQGELQTNTYVVSNGNKCFIVDPTGNPAPIEEYVKANGLSIDGLIVTHGHFDHTELVKYFKEQGVKAYIGENDDKMLSNKSNLALAMGIYDFPYTSADVRLKDGEVFTLADVEIKAIETAGHTAGGMTYLVDAANAMFTGDTLFRLSYGRTDFYGGDFEELLKSVRKLFEISKDYDVYPGHGDFTTLNYEKKNNPIFLEE